MAGRERRAERDRTVPEEVSRLLGSVPDSFGQPEQNVKYIDAARTRNFYENWGFLPLEETDLCGEDTPCLIMVKPLNTW